MVADMYQNSNTNNSRSASRRNRDGVNGHNRNRPQSGNRSRPQSGNRNRPQSGNRNRPQSRNTEIVLNREIKIVLNLRINRPQSGNRNNPHLRNRNLPYPEIDTSKLEKSLENLFNFLKSISRGRKTMLCKKHTLRAHNMECNEFRCMGERCHYSHCTIHESNKVRSGLFSDSHKPIFNEQGKDIRDRKFLDPTYEVEFFDRIIKLNLGPVVITFIIKKMQTIKNNIQDFLDKKSMETHQKTNLPEISIGNWSVLRGSKYRQKDVSLMTVSELIVNFRSFLVTDLSIPEWIVIFAEQQVRNLKFCNAWSQYAAKKLAGIKLNVNDICFAGTNCKGGLHLNPKKPVYYSKCNFSINKDIDNKRKTIECTQKKI